MIRGWYLIAAICTLLAGERVLAERTNPAQFASDTQFQASLQQYCRNHNVHHCVNRNAVELAGFIDGLEDTFNLRPYWGRSKYHEKKQFVVSLVNRCNVTPRPAEVQMRFQFQVRNVRCGSYEPKDGREHTDREKAPAACDSSCPSASRVADAACGANVRTITGLATVAPVLAPLLNKPESLRDACESQQKLTKLVTAMNGAFLASCGTTYLACLNSCDAAKKNPNCGPIQAEASAAYSRCTNYDKAVAQATQQTLFSGIQLSMVLSCGSDSKAAKSIANFCSDNPDSQACAEKVAGPDCSNPDIAASDPACICQDPEVARVTPICNQQKVGQGGVAGNYNTSLGTSGRGLLESTGLTDLLGNTGFNGGPVEGGAVGVDANMNGAGGGGGPQESGGPKGSGDGIRRGHGKGPYNTDILKGVGRSGGGVVGAAGMFPGGFRGYGTSDESKLEGMNLAAFLPKGEGTREISGMSVEARDGITGPMGPSIWQKISRRYKKMQGFMKP